ncbi:proteasome assembly chaperone 4 isoform X2 [Carya illinoinensis]|uniref:Proteasome assembly chaperone 4 n=1 Tax=Carya illinoinensis TaxID=32201 RepID=A0A8T1RNS7_CARIL|nr:proteasome assembly chaperone 4 isoform X2 [Carya illinoinensis]KAG6668315.1 hypothetical protein CIPAW_01G161800 [Carya illinoinensis]
MASGGSDVDAVSKALNSAQIFAGKQQQQQLLQQPDFNHKGVDVEEENGAGLEITCFSDVFNDVPLHFQILRLPKQIYVWIGCSSAKLGNLYAAAPTRPKDTVSVTSILGGTSDNAGTGIARRLVLKTGLNVILASNIPKNSPMLQAEAEKLLVQKLIHLGYTRQKAELSSS